MGELREGLRVQQRAKVIHHEPRVLFHGQHADPTRIVEVVVEHRLDPARLQRADDGLHVGAAGEDVQLHKQTPSRALATGPLLQNVDRRGAPRSYVMRCRGSFAGHGPRTPRTEDCATRRHRL